MKYILWTALFCASSLLAADSFPDVEESNRIAQALIEQVDDIDGLPDKIAFLTGYFLEGDYPYVWGPLGEGADAQFNQSPRYRFDVFDCTTFVETVISLAKAEDLEDFQVKMDEIRYKDAEVSFVTRNHFPSADWVPNNIANGIFVDATQNVREEVSEAGVATLARMLNTPFVYINRKKWFEQLPMDRIVLPGAEEEGREKALVALHALSDEVNNQWAYLPYLSLKTIFTADDPEAVLVAIPSGAVIQIVRPGWDIRELIGTRMLVSHQGFVIQHDGRAYLRHASSAPSIFRVTEQPLFDYLEPYWTRKGAYACKQRGKGKNCVQGINILTVVAMGDGP